MYGMLPTLSVMVQIKAYQYLSEHNNLTLDKIATIAMHKKKQ